jgi:hypothetical protein
VRLLLAAALLVLGSGLVGCDDDAGDADSGKDRAEAAEDHEMEGAADESTCRADAEEIDPPYGDSFPAAWTFPPDTTAYHVEELGSTGTVVTAVSEAPFDDVLDFLNQDAVDAGFEITEGETEEDDAEANWTSEEFRGRWTIRRSADCPGETVIQVLAAPVS